ncbi:MAG: UDP-N-acetylmuramate dehydrogenase [Gemmatimonadales bacterium]|nr:UDP-N-acetylmuramate dehydrogenase [Gemmatimonadales bacterium]
MARHGPGDVAGVDRVSARAPAFAEALRGRLRGEVREAEPLARYSTYRIGGPATVVLPAVAEDVGLALRLAHEEGVPWFALGLGSNILLPDSGLDALVIRLGKGLDRLRQEGERWTLGAGMPAPLAARRTAAAGFAGLHVFVGVPGSVGGGVYMNAGCHGGDWSDVVETVTVVDAAGRDAVRVRSQVPFTYRRSGLEGEVIVETTVRLRPEEQHRLDQQIAEMFEWRQRGTPFNQPCCGSVFKNPSGPSWERQDGPRTAGQLIEASGLKGSRVGGVEVSPMHANYFVNTGTATAADVRGLIEQVQRTVEERFGARLEPEVKLIGASGEYLNPELSP